MNVAVVLGILFAVVTVTSGTVVIVQRDRIAAWNARVNRDSFGRFGERVAQNSTPAWIVIVGVGLIAVGVVSALRLLFPGSG